MLHKNACVYVPQNCLYSKISIQIARRKVRRRISTPYAHPPLWDAPPRHWGDLTTGFMGDRTTRFIASDTVTAVVLFCMAFHAPVFDSLS